MYVYIFIYIWYKMHIYIYIYICVKIYNILYYVYVYIYIYISECESLQIWHFLTLIHPRRSFFSKPEWFRWLEITRLVISYFENLYNDWLAVSSRVFLKSLTCCSTIFGISPMKFPVSFSWAELATQWN